ncbi:MAG: hypothetical protein EOO41_04270 [Methanobacteriota archaeon]|nr:MAG: hypothetical protein EOO41_04270 [Euryarchaeota archaeon]
MLSAVQRSRRVAIACSVATTSRAMSPHFAFGAPPPPRRAASTSSAPSPAWAAHFMRAALQQAQAGALAGEVPVGAVVVAPRKLLPPAPARHEQPPTPVILSPALCNDSSEASAADVREWCIVGWGRNASDASVLEHAEQATRASQPEPDMLPPKQGESEESSKESWVR